MYSLSVVEALTIAMSQPSVLAKFAFEAKLVSDAATMATEFGSIAGSTGMGVFQNDVAAYSCPGTGGGVVGVGEGVGVGVEVGDGVGDGVGLAVGVEVGVGWGQARNSSRACLSHRPVALHLGGLLVGAAGTPDAKSNAPRTRSVVTKPKRANAREREMDIAFPQRTPTPRTSGARHGAHSFRYDPIDGSRPETNGPNGWFLRSLSR